MRLTKNIQMKVLSSFLFTLLISIFTMAQDNSIEFIDNDFAKAKEAAKKSGKLIFVDAYTTWCGPCKWMAANKFTNDTIAEFYNKNFISLKMDMEKGDGKEMAVRVEDIAGNLTKALTEQRSGEGGGEGTGRQER